ncbi:hypothetical protein TCSYLVIO_003017 [Trypanosoma cruzi]|nr:hypothetical protein TCSYLVIO_003017 [Trypanosoma cruzi]
MHEDHHNDGEWMSSTQHSVGESKQQQQRGAHGGFVHAYCSIRFRTPVAPPSPHKLGKRTCAHIVPDTNTQVGREFGAAAATRRNHRSHTPQQRCITAASHATEKSATTCFMESICNARVTKECRDAAFHIAFAIHVSLGSMQSPLLRSTPRAARVTSLEEVVTAHPLTVHCGTQINHTAWVRCHPANKSQEIPHCLVWHGRQSHYACERLFPIKNAAAPHARKKVWSIARKGVERENSRKGNTSSHEQPAHANTPLSRISPKIKITKKHATSQLQIAGAVAAHTPTSWACAAPRCSAL